MATLKYKIGDKVTLTNGNVMTIDQIDDISKWYRMREDPWNCYTDEMIENKISVSKSQNPSMLSARDRGRIDEIIKALKFLEEDKMICYANEIDFLNKIRSW